MKPIIRNCTTEVLPDAIKLLNQNKLPTNDLLGDLESIKLYSCLKSKLLIGIAGLQIFSDKALLRSLAVHPEYKGMGYGKLLVQHVETEALNFGVRELYLLTNSAEKYFLKFNYKIIPRDRLPDQIKQSQQFKTLCPVTAVAMKKTIEVKKH